MLILLTVILVSVALCWVAAESYPWKRRRPTALPPGVIQPAPGQSIVRNPDGSLTIYEGGKIMK